MDVDNVEQPTEEQVAQLETVLKVEGKKRLNVTVDDGHPFDLELCMSSYSGRGAIFRLLHIIQNCPGLATSAFRMADQRISQTRDVKLHQVAVSIYNSSPGVTEEAQINKKWVESTQAKNMSEKHKLEVELKTYQSNMIKESVRMAHRDLGNFCHAVGDDAGSLKHFTKSREFCSSSQHILEMCLSILELLIDQRNYAHITTYIYKAESALDVAAASTTITSAGSSSTPATANLIHKKAAPSAEREKVQTKLDVAAALSLLGQGNYEKAALKFLQLGNPKSLEDWNGKVITPGDIAIYGTLCALATLPRGMIKAQILENDTFGIYVEQEPYVRELVEAYLGSKFSSVLQLLDRYSARHYLDIHLCSHVQELMNLTRNRALVLYFQPFASIKLARMALAFGLSVKQLERQVVELIQAGEIKGRVDSQNKILKAKETDQRAALFARAIRVGTEMQSANNKLLLRMRLQQADLVVKAPKGQQGSLILAGDNSE